MEIMTFNWRWVVAILGLLIFAGVVLIPHASASVFVYGSTHNYSEVVLPNNSYVHQGENISRGNYYDLSGVWGWSGIVGNWNNPYNVGYTNPDNIKNLNLVHYQHILIDDSWNTGEWYQIDAIKTTDTGVFTQDHGNSYVFAVVPAEYSPEFVSAPKEEVNQTVVKSSSITVNSEAGLVQIPVTIVETVVPPVATLNASESTVHVITLPTTEPTPEITRNPALPPDVTQNPNLAVVTQKSPVSLALPIFALVVGGVFLFRRK